MDDLVKFLRERLNEDDLNARRHWNRDGVTSERYHGTPYDPARVCREVEARRRTLELHKAVPYRTYEPVAWICLECSDRNDDHYYVTDAPCATVRLLALPYVDHQDYREEWKP